MKILMTVENETDAEEAIRVARIAIGNRHWWDKPRPRFRDCVPVQLADGRRWYVWGTPANIKVRLGGLAT